jgi:hypothetical protein
VSEPSAPGCASDSEFFLSRLRPLIAWSKRRWSSPSFRRAFNIVWVVVALAVTVLGGWHFASAGWPLSHASPLLVALAGVLFLVAYPVKAFGWSRLFRKDERPRSSTLAAAGGAASITGIALPGRFDDVVRVAVVRRYPNCPAGVRVLVYSLFTLGLIDAVALMPLASVGAALTGSMAIRIALAIVAAGGIGAAVVILVIPRVAVCGRFIRFRLARWVSVRAPSAREAGDAGIWVFASWIVRGVALLVLLEALGIGLSLPLAVIFLCAGAAAAALPVAPAGAATQAGAGAAILVTSGVAGHSAINFAVASQALVILAGAAIVAATATWHGGRRFLAARAA